MTASVHPDNCLASTNLELIPEWDTERNAGLKPYDVLAGSHKKVWWKCSNGHQWYSEIRNRAQKKRGCPYCTRRKPTDDYNLAALYPELVIEWHPTKNDFLSPGQFLPRSNRRVWWLCKKGHEWEAVVCSRTGKSKTGCPYCANKIINRENCLATNRPDLAREWHPTKNKDVTPYDVFPNSEKRVWWQCEKGHEWQAYINNRSSGTGCPYCANLAVCQDNSLAKLYPYLIKEWHPQKNKGLTPDDIVPWTPRKVWWRCIRGHEWHTSVRFRTERGYRCPICDQKTSIIELRLYTELSALFDGVHHRSKIGGKEADIFIAPLNLAIEVDGGFWHKNNEKKDMAKNTHFKQHGFRVLRVRGAGLNRISAHDVICRTNQPELEIVAAAVRKIRKICNPDRQIKAVIHRYLKDKSFVNDDQFVKLQHILPSPLPGTSLKDINPALAIEWHPTKNAQLEPKDLSANSNRKVWWLCKKGHEWIAQVASRNRGVGCPYCAGKLPHEEYNLGTANPSLAKEWHPRLNGILTPRDVLPGSPKKVWWQCEKGHEWQASIANRHRSNRCPYCAHQTVMPETSLAARYPTIAAEWHPFKNALSPEDVFPSNKTKVWWLCPKKHEWLAQVANRVYLGYGCPHCRKDGK